MLPIVEIITEIIISILLAVTPSSFAERLTPSAVLIGDSIVYDNIETISSTLSSCGINPNINAQGGRRVNVKQIGFQGEQILPATTIVSHLLAIGYNPDTWIIAVGTNEIWTPLSALEADASIAEIERLLQDKKTIWTDININSSVILNYPESAKRAIIWNEALDRANIEVAKWTNLGTENLLDGIHPNVEGAISLAKLWCEYVR